MGRDPHPFGVDVIARSRTLTEKAAAVGARRVTTAIEPLPADHPLRRSPKATQSPHPRVRLSRDAGRVLPSPTPKWCSDTEGCGPLGSGTTGVVAASSLDAVCDPGATPGSNQERSVSTKNAFRQDARPKPVSRHAVIQDRATFARSGHRHPWYARYTWHTR